jgi:predicted transcriptional regulator
LSQAAKISPEKTKEMQERTRERNLIIQQLKAQGPSTVNELSKIVGMDKTKLFKHLVAMRQFGKVAVLGERDRQLIYCLPREEKS